MICIYIILVLSIILPDTCMQPGQVALTIDEGPTGYTQEIMRILEKKNVQATFHFNPTLTGSEFYKIYDKAEEDGHDIGVRTSPKRQYTDEMEYEDVENDLNQQVEYLQSKTQDKIIYARSPNHGGLPVDNVYKYFSSNGMILTTYSCNPQEDPTVDPVDRIYDFLGPNNPKNDSFIIQLYEQRLATDRNLEEIIDAIQQNGYVIVPLSTCLNGYKAGEPVKQSSYFRSSSNCSKIVDPKFFPILFYMMTEL